MKTSKIKQRFSCPLCGNTTIKFLNSMDHRKLAFCRKCSFIFAHIFDTCELEKLYIKSYYSSPDDPRIEDWIKQSSQTWKTLVCELEKHKWPICNLLDIGAGTGGFLRIFQQISPQTQLYAIESSKYAQQNMLNNINYLKILANFAEDICKIKERFDCITLLQCLEHVYEPLEVLKGIYERLSPGGILLITVPNRYSYKVLLEGRRDHYCYSNPTHLQFFSQYALYTCLKNVGFNNIKRISRYGKGEYTGIKAIIQYFFRKIGISTELRYIAKK